MTKQAMIDAINTMRKSMNAVILAHYYQDGEIQDIADATGDSYALSVAAANTDADVIVFCGVHFMAETAKILAPEKTVLLPEAEAGCPMADMITARALSAYKAQHPERLVVCYVNSTAEVKALSDVCVTSSNAEKILMHYRDKKLLYVPDKNLAQWLKYKHQLDIDAWEGYCCIHNDLTVELVDKMTQKHPTAKLAIHPEAPLEVLKRADYVGSTKGILDYVLSSTHDTFLIGTEKGIIHQMIKHQPHKTYIPLTDDLVCRSMKLTTIESLYNALKDQKHVIEVDASIQKNAKKALDLMIVLSQS